MTKLDKQTIKTLTELSCIECTEEEQDHLLQDLQKILHYFEQLNEIDTEHVLPCNHVLDDMANVMREDVIEEGRLSRKDFLDNAPSSTGGMIRVPTVIKQV